MKERKIPHKELFNLTTGQIGHCNDIAQLQFIITFTQARIDALKTRKKHT